MRVVATALCLLLLSPVCSGYDPFTRFHSRSHDSGSKPTSVPAASISAGDRALLADDYFPIEVAASSITTCPVKFDDYQSDPPKLPFYKNLIAHSCNVYNRRRGSWEDLEQAVSASAVDMSTWQPAGFVFHESRCGSTLVANVLGSVKGNRVYAESHTVSHTLQLCRREHVDDVAECTGMPREEVVKKLRTVMRAMGMPRAGEDMPRTFFKFQSTHTYNIDLVLEAFPNTPWIILIREPVQILASYLRDGSGSGACAHRHLPKRFSHQVRGMSQADHCAAYVEGLCDAAMRQLAEGGELGLAVNYTADLAAHIPEVLRRHFRVPLTKADETRMLDVSKEYSKSGNHGGGAREYHDDSERKANMASKQMHDTSAAAALCNARLMRANPDHMSAPRPL